MTCLHSTPRQPQTPCLRHPLLHAARENCFMHKPTTCINPSRMQHYYAHNCFLSFAAAGSESIRNPHTSCPPQKNVIIITTQADGSPRPTRTQVQTRENAYWPNNSHSGRALSTQKRAARRTESASKEPDA